MSNPLLVLAEPKDTFTTISSRPTWLAPIVISTLSLFAITWLGGCWSNIRDGLRWWSLLGPAIASPITVGMTGLGSTMVLYVVQRAVRDPFSSKPSYRTLFSLNAHCAIIITLGEIANFLLVHTELITSTKYPLANRFPLGLDLLLLGAKEPNIYSTILLHGTSVFILWYLVVLARGLQSVTGLSSGRAIAATAALWLAGVGLAVGAVYSAGGGTVFRISF